MGRKARERQAGAPLVSIIVLVRNCLDLTEACLASIERHTPEAHELVIVDNASGQETAAYLAEYARQNRHVRLIVNGFNVGFPAGCNQGISAARGEHVVLLNNDVVVTAGWLTRLLVPLERDPAVGIVGPRADRIGGQQAVPAARRVDDFDAFAEAWALGHQGQGQVVEWLVGFCLLIRGSVVKAIGGLDPRFGIGNFEDNDYCRRARLAGFRLWQADDVLLRHAESATFKSEGVNLDALMKRNGLAFSKKWNGHEPDLFIPPGSSDPVPRPTLSLCLATCNDGEFLEDCLRSAADLVDEICIVDTGSTDRTLAIAESFGARVRRVPRAEDARAASLDMATGDWLLVLDADERLLPTARLRVLNLAAHGAVAFTFRILSPTGSEVEVAWGARMFRSGARHLFNERRPDPPSIWREAEEGMAVGGLDICHEGYRRSVWDSPDKRLQTAHQVPATPELDLAQRARKDTGAPIAERIQWLRRALAQPWELGAYAGHAWALLSKLLVEAGNALEGVQAAKAGLAIDSSNSDLWFAWGAALHYSGNPAGALAHYKQCYVRLSTPEINRIGDVKLSQLLEAMNRCAADLGAPPFHLVPKGGKHRTLESHPPLDLPGSCEVVRWVGSEPVAFSILIPTMANRTGSFERLYAKLKAQAEGKPVEILALRDSGELSTGRPCAWASISATSSLKLASRLPMVGIKIESSIGSGHSRGRKTSQCALIAASVARRLLALRRME